MMTRAGTHTPVTEWMAMPVLDLFDWVDTIETVEGKIKKRAPK